MRASARASFDTALGERPPLGRDVRLDRGRSVVDEIQVAHQTGTPVRNMSPRQHLADEDGADSDVTAGRSPTSSRSRSRVAAAGDERHGAERGGEEQADGDARNQKCWVDVERGRSEERRRVGHVARGNDDVDDEQHAFGARPPRPGAGSAFERLARKARRHQVPVAQRHRQHDEPYRKRARRDAEQRPGVPHTSGGSRSTRRLRRARGRWTADATPVNHCHLAVLFEQVPVVGSVVSREPRPP